MTMAHGAQLTMATLRDRIGEQEKAGLNWPTVSLGAAELDQSLLQSELVSGVLYEMVPETYADFPATLGFGFGLLARILQQRDGYVLWVQPNYQALVETSLYPIGLASFGIDPSRIIHVTVSKVQNALWALDEALSNDAVSAVFGLIGENERTYDFTAARRLSMRAATHGSTALICLRDPGFSMATAAEMRWLVTSEPSFPIHRKGQSVACPGIPRWHVSIAKSRRGNTGHWNIEWNHETLSFRLAAPLADRTKIRISGFKARQPAAV